MDCIYIYALYCRLSAYYSDQLSDQTNEQIYLVIFYHQNQALQERLQEYLLCCHFADPPLTCYSPLLVKNRQRQQAETPAEGKTYKQQHPEQILSWSKSRQSAILKFMWLALFSDSTKPSAEVKSEKSHAG